MHKFVGRLMKSAKAKQGLTLSVCLCISTVGRFLSSRVNPCLNLRRRHKGIVSIRTGLEEAEAITACLASELKTESAFLFPRQCGAVGGGRQLGTAGQLWPQHAPRAGAGLTCVCTMFASLVIQDFHNLLVSLPLVQPGCNPVSTTKLSVFLGGVQKFKIFGLQLCENTDANECVRENCL